MRPLLITKQVTDREGESLRRYMNEVGRIPMITDEEEVELAIKIRNGETLALEKLVNANLRFVISVAKQYQGRGLKLQDLINEGNLGLVKAASKFDETRGFKFISYAVWWVRQGILSAITENARLVRLPLNKVNIINKINEACSQFEQHHHRMPYPDEISELIDIGSAEIKVCILYSMHHISLDHTKNNWDEGFVLSESISCRSIKSPEEGLLENSLTTDINQFLEILTSRESYVVRMYFGIGQETPMVMDEIAANLRITKERVRQIKTNAVNRLKRNSKSCFLKEYLG